MRDAVYQVTGIDDTIVAVSTPFGRGAMGIVRVSGSLSGEIVRAHTPTGDPFKHRTAVRSRWLDADGNVVDDVVVTMFRQPHSYTGQDIIEITAHGNPLILERIVRSIQSSGARRAGPGEFTWRAVANGKMDLLQAEAIHAFVEAQTVDQARIALQQMEGVLSKRIKPGKEKLIDLIAVLEAAVDFVEDDIETVDLKEHSETMNGLMAELSALLNTFNYGRLISDGLRLVIVGKPNVGKSSLFNRILGQDRVIVTEIPGTTRDLVSETMALRGVPLRFCDTAGIREAGDKVEGIGVERTLDALAQADLALVVLDGSMPLDDEDRRVLSLARGLPHVIIFNKSDLVERIVLSDAGDPVIRLSAKTGSGLAELEEALCQAFRERADGTSEAILTNQRQHEAVSGALASLERAGQAISENAPPEIVLVDLYSGLSELNSLTGEFLTEDILGRVFSKFCVGK